MAWLPFTRDPLSRDGDEPLAAQQLDNRFIPVRTLDLCRALTEEYVRARGDDDEFGSLTAGLCDVIEQEAAAFERMMLDDYAPFDPDRETLPADSDAAARSAEGYVRMTSRLNYLLDKANFEPLNEVEIDRVVSVANSHGLRVRIDPSRVEMISIWVRGRGTTMRNRRTWRHPIRGVDYQLPVFSRLAVLARMKCDPHIQIRLFKDIPEEDVEALLPHAEVAMTWLDRLVMVSGGVSKAGSTFAKVLTSAMVISQLMTLIVFALPVIIWRMFSGYRNARIARDSQRTRHLYYQSLANNAAAIHSLVSLIQQEEVKEVLLVYATCLLAQTDIADDDDLQRRIVAWVERRFGATIDFDIRDGLESMGRLKLWSDAARYRVIPPADAARSLAEHWLRRRSERYHERLSG